MSEMRGRPEAILSPADAAAIDAVRLARIDKRNDAFMAEVKALLARHERGHARITVWKSRQKQVALFLRALEENNMAVLHEIREP